MEAATRVSKAISRLKTAPAVWDVLLVMLVTGASAVLVWRDTSKLVIDPTACGAE
jgi:hypothetical protein